MDILLRALRLVETSFPSALPFITNLELDRRSYAKT